MTEAEWAGCTHPYTMVAFLDGRVSRRKLRWFAIPCCRRVWDCRAAYRGGSTPGIRGVDYGCRVVLCLD